MDLSSEIEPDTEETLRSAFSEDGRQARRGGPLVKRIVLALAGADDLKTEVARIVDEDLGLDGLVAAAH